MRAGTRWRSIALQAMKLSTKVKMKLKDKCVIVTGSTTGIGAAIASRFVAEGARVLVHGTNEERARKMSGELGDSADYHLDDLSSPEAPRRIVAAAMEKLGRIDAIVNNAANNVRCDFGDIDADFFDKVIAINLRTPLLLVQEAREELIKNQGSVLNVGSVLAYSGQSNLLTYCVSKGGLMTLSRNLANQLTAKGVRVNHVNVGWTLTDNEYRIKVGDGLPADWPETLNKQEAPSGKLIQPEEIAAAAVYWIGDESRPFAGSVVELEQYPVIGRIPDQQK